MSIENVPAHLPQRAGNEVPKPKNAKPKRRKKNPFVAGIPKKKSARLMVEAARRHGILQAARRLTDPEQRQVAELAFVRTHIDKALLAKEPRLLTTKWIGYRYLTPLETTEELCREYLAAYRRACEKHLLAAEPDKKQPIKLEFALNSRNDMTALWRARQQADALGVPYDIYCDTVMEGCLVNDRAKQPPLPNQMYGKLVRPRLAGRPDAIEVAIRLLHGELDDRFVARGSSTDPVQDALVEIIRTDVLAAADKPYRLSHHMQSMGWITEHRARDVFGGDIVDQAIKMYDEPTQRSPIYGADPYRPACFGFRVPQGQPQCATCVYAVDCQARNEVITQHLVETTGSGDPRHARQQDQARIRQRRRRQNLADDAKAREVKKAIKIGVQTGEKIPMPVHVTRPIKSRSKTDQEQKQIKNKRLDRTKNPQGTKNKD